MECEKYLCHECVGEKFARDLIKRIGDCNHRCSYCKRKRKAAHLSKLAKHIHVIFETYYRCRHDADLYPGYILGYTAEEVITECLDVENEEISEDIHLELQETYNIWSDEEVYNEDYCYKRDHSSTQALDRKWEEIKHSLQCESRYFNNHIKGFFDKIFSDINTYRMQDGNSAVICIDKDTPVFRARVFDSLEKVEDALKNPERNFGPPPHLLATSGRMNAQGIPVFYGAMSPEIAIAEVRPAVGSYAVVAQFRPLKNLRILDISALDTLAHSEGSLFDPKAADKSAIASFLRKLSHKMTIPVSGMRTDNEYLITQAVSEYLSVSEMFNLDGIRFRSTQQTRESNQSTEHYNIVLFSKSATVMDAKNKNCQYSVDLYESDYDDYWYHSRLNPEIRKIEIPTEIKYMHLEAPPSLNNFLQLDANSLSLHEIRGVVYQSEHHSIRLGKPLVREPKNYNEFSEVNPF